LPLWIARRAAPAVWKRIPWKMVWAAVAWLAGKGRERVERNLTQQEQSEFWQLLKRSRGRPSTLPRRDRARIKDIADKALRGR
jgi:hypothetical protein